MNISLCNSTVYPAIQLLRKKKVNSLTKQEVEALLRHADYQFEFSRYGSRVSQQEFVDYFMTFENLDASQIQNSDLRNHHACWLDLYKNLDWFEKKTLDFFARFNHDVIAEAFEIAVAGFPKHYKFSDYKIIFTCGIGQSGGYAHENGMVFDIMQLFRQFDHDEFKEMVSHEIHHLIFLDNILFDESSIEGFFLQWFAIEGLAIKFTDNAQGILSQKLHPERPANLGLDAESMQYHNDHFDANFSRFKENIRDIRSRKINTIGEVQDLLFGYWFSLYTDEQSKDEIPKLKQTRLYAMGNDLWGTIYDVYGMDQLYETLNHPETFIEKFNHALRVLHREEYLIV